MLLHRQVDDLRKAMPDAEGTICVFAHVGRSIYGILGCVERDRAHHPAAARLPPGRPDNRGLVSGSELCIFMSPSC